MLKYPALLPLVEVSVTTSYLIYKALSPHMVVYLQKLNKRQMHLLFGLLFEREGRIRKKDCEAFVAKCAHEAIKKL